MSQQSSAGAVLYAKHLTRMRDFYAQVCGLKTVHSEDDHVILQSGVFQLVIVAIPESIAASITVATPPVRRENTPIKLIFYVDGIAATRQTVVSLGGELNPAEKEWQFQGTRVCDGHDPEGNVVQFRESAR